MTPEHLHGRESSADTAGGVGYWAQTWAEYRRNVLALTGLGLVILMGLTAVCAPLIANDKPLYIRTATGAYAPAMADLFGRAMAPELDGINWARWSREDYGRRSRQVEGLGVEFVLPALIPYSHLAHDLPHRYEAPSSHHWLGTDDRGRDLAARMVWGARVSLAVGFVAMGIAIVIGILVGSVGGYFGGWWDFITQRIVEIVITFPVFFLILALLAFLPQSMTNIMVVLGATGWTGIARMIRGEILRLRKQTFVEASRALGSTSRHTISLHLLPNAIPPVLVLASFGIAGAILVESSLSFLGFGVPPPTASWGEALSQAPKFLDAWWLTIFPGLAIFLTVTAYNLVGDGLRDATDPRLRGTRT